MALNANHFFIFIVMLLSVILYFFKPTDIVQSDVGEVPQLELRNFTLYELGTDGLKDIMLGRQGLRFDDRIDVLDIDYTDSTRSLRNNIQADFGRYNNKNLITLEGNVRYYREDGMRFNAEKAIIDHKKESITVVGPFTMRKFRDKVTGSDLFYNTKSGYTEAKSVTGVFDLEKKE